MYKAVEFIQPHFLFYYLLSKQTSFKVLIKLNVYYCVKIGERTLWSIVVILL